MLREVRFLKGFNQWDMALKTGISQTKISLIERGYVTLRQDKRRRIARALHSRVEDLFPDAEREGSHENGQKG